MQERTQTATKIAAGVGVRGRRNSSGIRVMDRAAGALLCMSITQRRVHNRSITTNPQAGTTLLERRVADLRREARAGDQRAALVLSLLPARVRTPRRRETFRPSQAY